jgi:anaerobic selenocysteine-containing dehydrogenase
MEAQFFKHANQAYQDFAVRMGFFDTPQPVTFQLYQENLQKFRLSAEGLRAPFAPQTHRERILQAFDPLPDWYRPFGEALVDRSEYPYHAVTQRPAAMYHSWGSMNAWLRQIHTRNPLYVPGPICDEIGLKDGDWAWVISHHGRIKVEVARMEAVNASTLWTWNAIGKRAGTWALDAGAPEARKGFLLNHLIADLLPPREDGLRLSNSDPVTGQAAWYDLRVRIEKADAAGGISEPQWRPVAQPEPEPHPAELRYGQEWAQ